MALRQTKFSQYFALYPAGQDSDILADAMISRIRLDKRAKKMEVTLHLSALTERVRLDKVAAQISALYGIEKVWINPCFPPDSFTEDFWEEVKNEVKRQNPAANGFLEGSTVKRADNRLAVKLIHGGDTFLYQAGCDKTIDSVLFQWFGINTDVSFVLCEKAEAERAERQRRKAAAPPDLRVINGERPADTGHAPAAAPIAEKKAAPAKPARKKAPSGGVAAVRPGGGNILLGKTIKSAPAAMDTINQYSGRVVVCGEIFGLDSRKVKQDTMMIVRFNLTDHTTSHTCKLIDSCEKGEKLLAALAGAKKAGQRLLVRGEVSFDRYDNDISIRPYDIVAVAGEEGRKDLSEEKRIELHLHTNMSAMDAVITASEAIAAAAKWGHEAIAITDHGVVQAFPEAMKAGKANNIKILYGVEGYFVDDMAPIVFGSKETPLDGEFILFDIETTGLNRQDDRITEIGAVRVRNGEIRDSFDTFVNPKIPIPPRITELTGINDEMVKDAPGIREALQAFYAFCGDSVLVAHNAKFDTSFIKTTAARLDMPFTYTFLDTLTLAKALLPELKSYKLNLLVKHLKLPDFNHHRACDDAMALARVFIEFIHMLENKYGVRQLQKIGGLFSTGDPKKAKTYHIIILAANEIGLKNLYKLVSLSNLDYYYKRPRLPKTEILKNREGLIIGSACEAGQLYSAFLDGADESELEEIASFYDYLEIQPVGNNRFMVRNGKLPDDDAIRAINKRVVALGEKLGKPVVATSDAHFLNPEDEIYRDILLAGHGFSDVDQSTPIYFHTTDEMLEEFSYLGEQKAREVVIDNTHKVSQMCQAIKPIRDGFFPPEMDGAEEEMIEISYRRVKELYGDNPDPIVAERLEKELGSITKHQFSVLYMIAQRLVSNSLENGYIVGSRGSVGSSFEAYLLGITEVNSLPAHYRCPKCKHAEFVTDGSSSSGVDMPDKDCPLCGTPYVKDGFDIPFETFLGFDGDKTPDIDLNFSGEYQARAHKYCEELFGAGYVFRAGTIGTLADKTAYGYVKKYLDERGRIVPRAEETRLVEGCTGVRRTSGQHPGGLIVVPKSNEIYDFTPVQHPADDPNTDIITTHFDYHAIDQNLLKLDMLGHDDPTVIKMLEDTTGVNAREIPLDDPETMSIFTSNEVLGIEPDDIIMEVGSIAIPEFGTKFTRGMLIDTKPKTFSELIKIAGLSHGTDVWLGNAQELIRNHTVEFKDVIGCRDDIMIYLIYKGMDPLKSFKIMEFVRKGRPSKDPKGWLAYEQQMKEAGIEPWFIDSCRKIKYMFPKAHAAAYVIMAFRIAWFKVHKPAYFYAAYYTVRADAFDCKLMSHGIDKVYASIKELEQKADIKQKEKDTLTVLEVCYEMYKRGFQLLPVDLYRSDARKFIVTKDGILSPFNSIQGLGDAAAERLVEAREEGRFMSKDDLRLRGGVSAAIIEEMEAQGIIKDLPQSSQVSFFETLA